MVQDRLQLLLTRMLKDEDNKYCVDCDAKGDDGRGLRGRGRGRQSCQMTPRFFKKKVEKKLNEETLFGHLESRRVVRVT